MAVAADVPAQPVFCGERMRQPPQKTPELPPGLALCCTLSPAFSTFLHKKRAPAVMTGARY